MTNRVLALCVVALALSACESSRMKPSENQTLAVPAAESSRVVFLRPSSFGGAIQATLYEISAAEPDFIGIISTDTKIAYDTTPGPHRFMVESEAADFMEATLSAGKTYYAVVTPRMGAWKARFSLWPVKAAPNAKFSLQSAEVQGWIKGGKFVSNTPESEQWFTENRPSIVQKQTDYLAVWKGKTPAEVAERTLDESDGVAP